MRVLHVAATYERCVIAGGCMRRLCPCATDPNTTRTTCEQCELMTRKSRKMPGCAPVPHMCGLLGPIDGNGLKIRFGDCFLGNIVLCGAELLELLEYCSARFCVKIIFYRVVLCQNNIFRVVLCQNNIFP